MTYLDLNRDVCDSLKPYLQSTVNTKTKTGAHYITSILQVLTNGMTLEFKFHYWVANLNNLIDKIKGILIGGEELIHDKETLSNGIKIIYKGGNFCIWRYGLSDNLTIILDSIYNKQIKRWIYDTYKKRIKYNIYCSYSEAKPYLKLLKVYLHNL